MYIRDYFKCILGGIVIGLPVLILSGFSIGIYLISLIFTIPFCFFVRSDIIKHDIKVSANYDSLYEKNLENKPTINVNINEKK